MLRVSILLPTYNRGDILSNCINSVINQSYKDWELLILDDASTDNTMDICKKYVNDYANIYYFRNETNIGLPSNRNVGIRKSKAELIQFIEDDLILDKDFIKILINSYDQLSEISSVGGICPRLIESSKILINTDLNEPFIQNKYTGEIINNYSLISDHIMESITMHACSLYSRELLLNIGGYSSSYQGTYTREETDLNFRIRKNGYKFYYQSKAFAEHKKINIGGCREQFKIRIFYFYVLNHSIFAIKFFKFKAIYMIPLFTLRILYDSQFRR